MEAQVDMDLDLAVKELGRSNRNNVNLIEHIEELRQQKEKLIEEKGARLAEKP